MNDTTLMLSLAELVVDRGELDPDGCRVVHVSTTSTPRVCPSCAVPSIPAQGWVTTGAGVCRAGLLCATGRSGQ